MCADQHFSALQNAVQHKDTQNIIIFCVSLHAAHLELLPNVKGKSRQFVEGENGGKRGALKFGRGDTIQDAAVQ